MLVALAEGAWNSARWPQANELIFSQVHGVAVAVCPELATKWCDFGVRQPPERPGDAGYRKHRGFSSP